MCPKIYKKINGFSLLELMIVLTIISILTVLAIPNYRLYINKAKFSELITQVVPYKTSVELCAQLLGGLGSGENNCGTPGKNEIPGDFAADPQLKTYVATIHTAYQAPYVFITVASQGLSENYTYVLKASYSSLGHLVWQVDPSSSCLKAGLCHG